MRPSEIVLAKLSGATENASGWSALCPAHEDKNASLSVADGEDGRCLLKCHAGCDVEAIVGAINLTMADLFAKNGREASAGEASEPSKPHRHVVARYDYTDEAGAMLFQVLRFEPKGFAQRRPVAGHEGEWAWGLSEGWYKRDERGSWRRVKGKAEPDPATDVQLPEVRRVLFRLPELLAAKPTRGVIVVEGEKDALTAAGMGFLATTGAQGAGKWRPEYALTLKDRRVYVIADKDEPGRQHAKDVAASLLVFASEVRVGEMPDVAGRPVKDLTDWVEAGGTAEALKGFLTALPRQEAAPAAQAAGTTDQSPEAKLNKLVESGNGQNERGCDFPVGRVTIQDTDPPIVNLWIHGRVVTVETEEIRSSYGFSCAYFRRFHRWPVVPSKPGRWRRLVNSWTARAEVIEAPPEGSAEYALGEEIALIVAALPVGETKADVVRGRVIVKAGRRCFQTRTIAAALDRRRKEVALHRLTRTLRELGYEAKVVNVAGESARLWVSPDGQDSSSPPL